MERKSRVEERRDDDHSGSPVWSALGVVVGFAVALSTLVLALVSAAAVVRRSR